ncbi:hypothetical protein CU097_013452 [Rhizopus azygosporus]|uniref:Heme peroxidase n=1 Tax=Rhizopus azygosporus TaxID=86630 RepID=A0A367K9T1_RHIAZ|nr:hypothetical protein CU097_013452 [Rhizopus azygosporus]
MLNSVSPNNNLPPPKMDIKEYLHAVENRMDQQELFKHFTILVDNIKSSKAPGSARAVEPTPSSNPTGSKWTWAAIKENIKHALNINDTTVGALRDIVSLPIGQQITLLKAVTERILSSNFPVNDRNNTFEAVMEILGKLGPEYSELNTVVTQPLIATFYNDLPKPYINYVGHQFRTADGSQNSLIYPEVGRAGSNYVRTVTSSSFNNEKLPPAKEVFDRLMRRPDGTFSPHEGGVNMLLFYLAILITHDLFSTDPKNPQRNLTTSYLDLSPLYGNNREQQESVREMKGGLLKPDQWYDKRLVVQPSGVAALMVVFSRNHNYIAKKLLEINENGRFSYGPGKPIATEEEQDEALFQTARLINNGCYANVIIHDYIRTIIGTTADSDFVLDPFATPSNPIYGNAVSIEFNIIYRWHAAVGEKDAAWLKEVMDVIRDCRKGTYKQCPVSTLTSKAHSDNESMFDIIFKCFNDHFVHASEEELEKGLPIAGTHRNLDTGSFPDVDIIKAIRYGFEQSASEVGNGQNTPSAFEMIEIAGINQSRALGTCYFNEFRKFLNLMPLNKFSDFSEKPSVQKALEEMYGTVDKVELYAGLMVERSKPIGLRLPYTMGRAILSDAVNLLRNDRILTKEMTPITLTNWGFKYIRGEPEQNNRVFPRMLRELFPDSAGTGFTDHELKTLFNVPSALNVKSNKKQ